MDAVALDLFAPVGEDWIRGDGAYLSGWTRSPNGRRSS